MRYVLILLIAFFLASCAIFKPSPKTIPQKAPTKEQIARQVDSLIGEGLLLFKNGKDSLAILRWKEVLKLDDKVPEAYNYIGFVLEKEGKLKEALPYFEKALALDSTYYQAWNNAGYTLFQLNRFKEAKKDFEKALVLNPNFEKAKDNLKLVNNILSGKLNWTVFSMTEELAMDPDALDQIKGYQHVLKMDSSYAKAHNNLAVIYYYEGKTDSAFVHLHKALAYDKDYPEAINNLGYLYKQQGNYDLAIRLFFKALTLKPRYIDALNNLGETYILKGEKENARRVFRTVLELEPNNRVAKEMLAKITQKK